MRVRGIALAVIFSFNLAAQQWQFANPGSVYEFPRDHFSHPEYQTEWWYYTGNLRATDGRRFGFELTFFRQREHLTPEQMAASDPVWRPEQIYLAHLALSDIHGQKFFHTERINRAGPGLAGAALADQKYWNGNWHSKWISLTTGEQELQAVCDQLKFELRLKPEKPFVINGQDGISVKGPLPGEASHYISNTRLGVSGKLTWQKHDFDVSGVAWMDHEYFSDKEDNDLNGWDWFAIQLDNDQELMLYRLRRKSGDNQFSSGTYVDASGQSHFLNASQFEVQQLETWHSKQSAATYPISWRITVPSLKLDLTERTALADQELYEAGNATPTYWEGAVTYDGSIGPTKVRGVGYLEMTGYAASTQGIGSP